MAAPALWFTEVALHSVLQSSSYAQGHGVRCGFLSPGSTPHSCTNLNNLMSLSFMNYKMSIIVAVVRIIW